MNRAVIDFDHNSNIEEFLQLPRMCSFSQELPVYMFPKMFIESDLGSVRHLEFKEADRRKSDCLGQTHSVLCRHESGLAKDRGKMEDFVQNLLDAHLKPNHTSHMHIQKPNAVCHQM